MNYQQIIEAWNAQADERNQWDVLGEDEKVEFAARIGALDAKRAPIMTDYEAAAYFERVLWEFIDVAAVFPRAKPDPKTWSHVMAYAPIRRKESLEDAKQLRFHAASLTYNDTTAEGEAKHRLYEIAMRIESGYYAMQGGQK